MKIINLLPTSEQKLLQQEKVLHKVKRFCALAFCTYILLAAVLFVFRTQLLSNLNSLDQQIATTKEIINKQDSESLRQQINAKNDAVTDYISLYNQMPQWSGVLSDFAKLVPPDVDIQSFTASQSTGQITITGISATRDAVLLLRNNILASSDFKDIDLPFDNIQKPVNVQFHYSFSLQDGVLNRPK